MKKIVLVGSGNVATHLGISLKEKGNNILQVISKNKKNAKTLADRLSCNYSNNLNNLREADLIIVSVSDYAISEVMNQIPEIPVVHTSGSVDLDVCSNLHSGVFYPLQTFNKNIYINLSEVPICIEANNAEFEKELVILAKSISNNIVLMNSNERKKIHIAAIFACNFSNHMYSISDEILSKLNIDFKLLLPLINQTVKKLNSNKAIDVQTGPAKRGDLEIINKHINLISDETIKELYQKISESIIKHHE